MQQIKKSHHVPSCNRIKNETLLRSFSLIVIFNFRFALIALQLLPVNPLPPVNQLAIFSQINWLSNCLQTLFWRSKKSANMMINQPNIKTENLSYSEMFFSSIQLQHQKKYCTGVITTEFSPWLICFCWKGSSIGWWRFPWAGIFQMLKFGAKSHFQKIFIEIDQS